MGFDIILKSVSAEGLVWKTKFCSGQLGQDLCTLLIFGCSHFLKSFFLSNRTKNNQCIDKKCKQILAQLVRAKFGLPNQTFCRNRFQNNVKPPPPHTPLKILGGGMKNWGIGFDIIQESVLEEGLVWKTVFCSGQLGQDLCTLLIYKVYYYLCL